MCKMGRSNVNYKWIQEEKEILTTVAFMDGVIAKQRQLKENQEVGIIQEKQFGKCKKRGNWWEL